MGNWWRVGGGGRLALVAVGIFSIDGGLGKLDEEAVGSGEKEDCSLLMSDSLLAAEEGRPCCIMLAWGV